MTIEVLNVCKKFNGKEVLKDVTMNISGDDIIAVSGGRGSGKTTLLRILLGLEKADSGEVNLLGDYKYAWINAGTVFQEDRLCPGFTAAQNVAMVNARLSVRVARQSLEMLLPPGAADRPVEELTAAQRRMVCIVRACIIPSDVRFMDEPFFGMTEEEKEKSIRYIRQTIAHTPLVLTCLPEEVPSFSREYSLD